jgi:ribonuclease E
VARQLRLRDLAGLVVIDFIDMEEKRNNRSVEKRLKDHLKNDRARIQVGRISHFGLLEMSRQRIRASVLESTMQVCPHCNGTGHIRSQSSVALHVLRGIEEYLLKNTTHNISVRTTPDIALYLLNHKRGTIIDYETRFGVQIIVEADAHVGAQHFAIDRGEAVENPVKIEQILHFEPEPEDDDVVIEEEIDEEEEEAARPAAAAAAPQSSASDENGRKRKRRRRRRGRGRENGDGTDTASFGGEQAGDEDALDDDEEGDAEGHEGVDAAKADQSSEDGSDRRKRRRRGKRGGRRNRPEDGSVEASADDSDEDGDDSEGETEEVAAVEVAITEVAAPAEETPVEAAIEEEAPAKPKRARRSRAKAKEEVVTDEAARSEIEAQPVAVVEEAAAPAEPEVEEASEDLDAPAKPTRANRDITKIASEPVVKSSTAKETPSDAEADKPKKGGWWQRRGFF